MIGQSEDARSRNGNRLMGTAAGNLTMAVVKDGGRLIQVGYGKG